MTVNEKIELIRNKMNESGLDAFIIPSNDPHISEYVPDYWKCRQWASGFTGSAGTLVITNDKAGLWTDSRYFIQAANQLQNTEIELYKLKTAEVLDYPQWLTKVIHAGGVVGFDAKVYSSTEADKIITLLGEHNIMVNPNYDIISDIWNDRPSLPSDIIFALEEKYSGLTVQNKLEIVRNEMDIVNAEIMILSGLDEIAWLFNIRCSDITYNPVTIAYAAVSMDEAYIFTNTSKIDDDSAKYFDSCGIIVNNYEDIYDYISKLKNYTPVFIDPSKTNYQIEQLIKEKTDVISDKSIIAKLKAIKNNTEIEGIKSAMVRDGVALVKFLYWLEENIGKIYIDEYTAGEQLLQYRKENDLFYSESFGVICGYKSNGAITHYEAEKTTALELQADGFFLFDSGGQYYDGTTDITRTIHFSTPTEEECEDYTAILKGMIDLTMAVFPSNTRGAQLDVLARRYLWKNGANYLHGTGHGVGCFLNVHEGPQSIRMEDNPTFLEEGMVTSNEPAIYRTNKYGIRIENLILTEKAFETEYGKFLKFDTLTLCPIDTKPIKIQLMDKNQIAWLNEYHKNVYKMLSPHLEPELQKYLKIKTKKIGK